MPTSTVARTRAAPGSAGRVEGARPSSSGGAYPGGYPAARTIRFAEMFEAWAVSERSVERSHVLEPRRLAGRKASRSETLHERGSRRTTTTVQPGATTRPRRRSLRSRPGGCRRRPVPRWQPSAGVQGPAPRGAIGARRESAVPEPCVRRRRAVVAARAIQGRAHAIGAALCDVVQAARDVVQPLPDPREIQVEGGPRAV